MINKVDGRRERKQGRGNERKDEGRNDKERRWKGGEKKEGF